MGDPGFGGKWCLERLAPQQYDDFFRRLQATISRGAMPAMNERAKGWAKLAFDFDCEPLPFLDHDAERRRVTEFVQLARLFVQELEMHFTGYEYASCVVARSDLYRFRLLFPGVCYIGLDTVGLLSRMVKRKCHGTPLTAYFEDGIFDMAPTVAMALRIHGTCKDGRKAKQYRVIHTVRDSQDNEPAVDRLSIRPNAEDYATLFEQPQNAYLQAASTFAREQVNGAVRVHSHYWRHSVLGMLWDMEPREDESDSEDMEEDLHTMLLLSKRLLVVEYRGDRAVLLLHGDRGDSATVYYQSGDVRYLNGLQQHQFTEEELRDGEVDLLEGPLIEMFTPHLRPPRVRSLLQFPLELFTYSRGYCPLQVVWDETAGKYEFNYTVSDRRRVEFEMDTGRMVDLAMAAVGKTRPEEFIVTSETTVCRNPQVRYCNQAFRVGNYRAGTVIVEIEADCGTGKTVFALEYIKKMMERAPASTLLVVAPRAQLCSQLMTKVRDIIGVDVHNYHDGAWPEDSRACVVTLDSLVKVVAPHGVERAPTIILLDEVSLTAQHLASSSTFSSTVDGRLRTLQTLQIIMARSQRVVAMDAHFGFGASLFLAMVAVKRLELERHSSLHYLHLSLQHRQPVQYTLLNDEGRRVQLIRLDLIAGKRVIVFEPTPRIANALADLFQEWPVLVIHGHSESETKEQFASDPNAYLHRHGIRLLIHTTSIGVGVSIDNEAVYQPAGGTAHYFDTSYVSYRPYLPDTAIVQGCFRARDLGHDVRNINFIFDRAMRARYHRLLSIPTVADALVRFETQLMEHRDLYKRYQELVIVSGINGRCTVDYTDINTVFIACMLASGELAVDIQAITCRTRLFDESIEFAREGVVSDAADIRNFKRAVKGVKSDLSIKVTDGPRTVSQKERLLHEIGYGFDAGKRSPAFMGRLELGMSHPSNLRRMAALLTLLTCDSRELRQHVVGVLNNVTESMPLYQTNDSRGITVGAEALLAAGALKSLGFDTTALDGSTPRSPVNTEVLVESTSGELVPFSAFFDTMRRTLHGERWNLCMRSKSTVVRTGQFLNAFFGGKVYGVRSGVLDKRQIRLSGELVPGYLRANGLEVPEPLSRYCARFDGTWNAFMDAETRGVPQLAI